MFYLLSLLMIIAALVLVLPRLLRPRLPKTEDSDIIRQQNIATAREQLQSLHAADNAPSTMLSADAQREYETEIQNRLLEDAPAKTLDDESMSQNPAHTGKGGAWLAAFVLFIGAPLCYWFAGTPQTTSQQTTAPVNLKSAVIGLQKHINENPNDGEALALMGTGTLVHWATPRSGGTFCPRPRSSRRSAIAISGKHLCTVVGKKRRRSRCLAKKISARTCRCWRDSILSRFSGACTGRKQKSRRPFAPCR